MTSEFTKLNLGCGTDQRRGDEWLNVDAVPECDPDKVVDLNDLPWPFEEETAEYIFASHVFEHLEDVEGALRECARILEPGGKLDIRLPISLDMRADPDHLRDNEWTWRTPEFYAGLRHWDVDIGLDLVSRDVELWVHQPGVFGWAQKQKIRWLMTRHGSGEWCFGLESTSGEFKILYQRRR